MKKFFISFFFFLAFSDQSFSQTGSIRPFPLSSIKLNDGPFLKAQQSDLRYILSLEPDRLLAPFLKEAGLAPKAPYYGSWESSGLGGQTGGHYLSALAQMYAATGQPELKRRLDYMVNWLQICQEKNGNGYVGGVPDGMVMWRDIALGKIEAGNFSLNKKWVPWYNMHKLYAGLIDAWQITGNQQAKQVLVKLADWCYQLCTGLSDAQIQEMLRCEQGGMNEVLAEVSSITGDPKFIQLARRFSDRRILNPLLKQKDELTGLHANTQIPKVIGYMRIAELSADTAWKRAAQFFWQTVTKNRTVSIGGNSVREHFNPVDNFSSLAYLKEGPETCNSYNMLRLSRHLFLDQPSGRYMDYYERTTYNHILSAQHPDRGGFVYLTPLRPQHYRVYSSPQQSFWCCVGTGLENHAKYGELIYSHSDNDLYINLFIPSTLTWTEKSVILTQRTKFPFEESSELDFNLPEPANFTVHIRKPSWLKGKQMIVKVNNSEVKVSEDENSYLLINRMWRNGDKIQLSLPMETVTEPFPDNSSWLCFVHGPIVLAAATSKQDLVGLIAGDGRKAHIPQGRLEPVSKAPVIISASNHFKPDLEVLNAADLRFGASKYIYQKEYRKLELQPFFQIHDSRYMIYWPVSSLKDVKVNLRKWEKEDETANPLDMAVIDEVAPGEQQPEVEHEFEGEKSATGVFKSKPFRNAEAWFSYKMRNPEKNAGRLMLTYYGAQKDRAFDVYVDDVLLSTIKADGSKGEKFIDEQFELPEKLKKSFSGKPLEIKFVAKPGTLTADIFYIRLLK